jgi:hypothetical protein
MTRSLLLDMTRRVSTRSFCTKVIDLLKIQEPGWFVPDSLSVLVSEPTNICRELLLVAVGLIFNCWLLSSSKAASSFKANEPVSSDCQNFFLRVVTYLCLLD